MFQRTLGKTGVSLSVVGFGGIIVMDATPEDARRDVALAVERGVNYFDVAPSYGNAEDCLGPALEPFRKDVFLACKTGKRDAQGAEEELHASLKRMRTDHFDLYQLHAVTTPEDVAQILGPGGALETFERARTQGLVRFLGFSAHSEAAALALMDAFPFDTILFPFNWVTWHEAKFGPQVMDVAQKKGLGILALKALAKRQWNEGEPHRWNKTWYSPAETFEEASLALRFTLSLPVTAAVTPGHAELLTWACDIADQFTPITVAENAHLAQQSAGLKPVFA